jgi:hypothetical protein
MKIGTGVQTIFRFWLSSLGERNVGITNGICEIRLERASYGMMYLPSLVKIGTGVQVIIRLSHSNFRGCNTDITNGGISQIRR